MILIIVSFPLPLTFNFYIRFRARKQQQLCSPPTSTIWYQQLLLPSYSNNCPCAITLNLDAGVHNFSNKVSIPPRRGHRFMVCNTTLKNLVLCWKMLKSTWSKLFIKISPRFGGWSENHAYSENRSMNPRWCHANVRIVKFSWTIPK